MRKTPTSLSRRIQRILCCLLVPCALLSLDACSNKFDREAYIEWVTDYANGLHVEKKAFGFVLDLQYQPADFLWLQNQEARPERDSTGSSEMQYYTLKIAVDDNTDLLSQGVRSATEKQEKLYYLSYHFQHDLSLEENGKTLPCVLFHFEQIADSKNYRTFLLGFENTGQYTEQAVLTINSRMISSLPVRIRISKKDIPSLAI